MIRWLLHFVWITGAALLSGSRALADATPIVVAAGVNTSFDQNLAPLNFAETDAERFAHAMATVGGVDAANTTLLRGPTAAEFVQAIRDRIATAPKPARLVLYFSGHADDRGLHFRYGALPMEKLRALLSELKTSTKILFIDSCFSGSISAKGVVSAKEFDLPKLDTDELSGSVFLTASSAREAAYESKELSGSLFTHYVLAGLNGAADGNSDGLVTVDELYQYVYRETHLQTLAYPSARAQHPEFHADLHGRGALVLSRPNGLLGKVEIDAGVMGTVRLVSVSGLGSFSIPYNTSALRSLSVPEGTYRALVRRGDEVGEASISVVRGATVTLRPRSFNWHALDMELASNAKGSNGAMAASAMMMVALGRTMGGPAALATAEFAFAQAMGTKTSINSKWTVMGEGALFQSNGSLSGQKMTNVGAKLGLGVVQAWTSVSMRGILGLNLARNWQTLVDTNGYTYHNSVGTSPGGYIGLLFPIGQSLLGQFSLAARMDLSPMQDASGANRDVSQYLIGLEVEL